MLKSSTLNFIKSLKAYWTSAFFRNDVVSLDGGDFNSGNTWKVQICWLDNAFLFIVDEEYVLKHSVQYGILLIMVDVVAAVLLTLWENILFSFAKYQAQCGLSLQRSFVEFLNKFRNSKELRVSTLRFLRYISCF